MEERTVTTARTAGFCFGVKRAVDKVYEQIEQGKTPIYTYGPIIHNEEVVGDLESKGVRVIHSEEELKQLKEGTIVLRSHGVSEHIYDLIRERGLKCVDATCPFVIKIHQIVKKAAENDDEIIIIGNEDHPEVRGIRGWCKKVTPMIVADLDEAEKIVISEGKKACLVSQTTFNYNYFKEIVEIIIKNCYNISVVNTICSATEERQTEARQIARQADTMIVIGGKTSSNTQKLYEICRKECKNCYYIQTVEDLYHSDLRNAKNVGITAGASTPKSIIEEVHTNVRSKF